MKIRVLGCSGAIAQHCRTTSFLIDGHLLIDAGTGVGDLTVAEMAQIEHVFLTHSHLDHIAALPLMVDAVSRQRSAPLQVHALAQTVQALRQHIFNDTIWPDFTRLPCPAQPMLRLDEIQDGQHTQVLGKTIQALPARHTVACVGYAVAAAAATPETAKWWVFSGDTCGPNPAFWQWVNAHQVAALVIEATFSSHEAGLARISGHHSPQTLADELDHISHDRRFPIYVTHTKPAETVRIMQEVQQLDQTRPGVAEVKHDIRWLQAGQELSL